jgi:hypothetical protein
VTDALDCIDTFLQGKRPIAYYPEIGQKLKSESAGVLLCQFIYWRKKGIDPDGWVYKSAAEIEAETGLTYEKQLTARKKLKSLGLIEERHRRLDHQIDFRVSMGAFQEVFQVVESVPSGRDPIGDMGGTQIPVWVEPSALWAEPSPPNGRDPYRYKEAEITTETTTEITNKHSPVLVEIPGSTKSSIESLQKQWFDEFWRYYPRKDDKTPCWERFKVHIQTQERFDKTMEALSLVLPEWATKEKQFIPYPKSWLGKKPWNDVESIRASRGSVAIAQPPQAGTARPSMQERTHAAFVRQIQRMQEIQNGQMG